MSIHVTIMIYIYLTQINLPQINGEFKFNLKQYK